MGKLALPSEAVHSATVSNPVPRSSTRGSCAGALPRVDARDAAFVNGAVRWRYIAANPVADAGAMLKRLSFGSRSQGGERMIERLLSVDQTCRLQRRSFYSYLADALTAKARGDPVPSLMRA